MKIFGKFLLASAITASLANAAPDDAKTTPTLKIFYAPEFMNATWYQFDGKPAQAPVPLARNRFADCLPGKLYDLRPFLESFGVKLGADEWAVFNPERNVCVMYGTANELESMSNFADAPSFPSDIILEGSISVDADADGKNPAADLARWQVAGRDGKMVECSSEDDHGVGYHFRAEGERWPDQHARIVYNVDEEPFDVTFLCKIEYGGRVYGDVKMPEVQPKPDAYVDTSAKVTTTITITPGKRETLPYGKTPEGKIIYLHIGGRVKSEDPVSGSARAARKKKQWDSINKKKLLDAMKKDMAQ